MEKDSAKCTNDSKKLMDKALFIFYSFSQMRQLDHVELYYNNKV